MATETPMPQQEQTIDLQRFVGECQQIGNAGDWLFDFLYMLPVDLAGGIDVILALDDMAYAKARRAARHGNAVLDMLESLAAPKEDPTPSAESK